MPAPAAAQRGGFEDDSDSEVDEAAIRAEAVKIAENRAMGKIPYPSGKSPLDGGVASSDEEFMSVASSPLRDRSLSVIDAAFRRPSVGVMASTSTKGTENSKSSTKRKPFGEQNPNKQHTKSRSQALEDGWSVKSTDQKSGFSARPLSSSRSRTSSLKSKRFAPNAALSDIPSSKPAVVTKPASRKVSLTSTGAAVNGVVKNIPSTIANQTVQPIPKPFTYQSVRKQIAAASAVNKPDSTNSKAKGRSTSQPTKKKRSTSVASNKSKPTPAAAPTTPRGNSTNAPIIIKSPGKILYEQEMRDRKEAENRVMRHKDFKKQLNEQERKKAREFTQAIREKEKDDEEEVLEYAWKPPYGGRSASPPTVSPQAPRVVSKSPQRNRKHPHIRDTFTCLDPRQYDSEAYLIWLARKDEEAKRVAQQRVLENKRRGVYEQVIREKRDNRLNDLIVTQSNYIESSRKEREEIDKRAAVMMSPRSREYYSTNPNSFYSDTSPHRPTQQVLSIKNTFSPLHVDPLTPQVLPSIQQFLSPSTSTNNSNAYNVDAYFPTNSSRKSKSQSPQSARSRSQASPPTSTRSWRHQEDPHDLRSVSQVESLQMQHSELQAKTATLQQQMIDQQRIHEAQLAEQQEKMEQRMRLFEQQLLDKHHQEQLEREAAEEDHLLELESRNDEVESQKSKQLELERQQTLYEMQLREERETERKEHEQRLKEENRMLQKQWEEQQQLVQQRVREQEQEKEREEEEKRKRESAFEYRRQLEEDQLAEEAEREREREAVLHQQRIAQQDKERERELSHRRQQELQRQQEHEASFRAEQQRQQQEMMALQHQQQLGQSRENELLNSLRDRRRSGATSKGHPKFKLRLLFMNADKNGDGFVSPEEAFTALAEEGWPEPNDDDANTALAMVDPGRRGTLSFYDFQQMVDAMYKHPQKVSVRQDRPFEESHISPFRSKRNSHVTDNMSFTGILQEASSIYNH